MDWKMWPPWPAYVHCICGLGVKWRLAIVISSPGDTSKCKNLYRSLTGGLINFSLLQKWIKVPLNIMPYQESGAGSHHCTFRTSSYEPMHDVKLKWSALKIPQWPAGWTQGFWPKSYHLLLLIKGQPGDNSLVKAFRFHRPQKRYRQTSWPGV